MPSVSFKVKAIFDYKSDEPDDLNFSEGQIITITEEEDADWYTGEYVNASGDKLEGIFPRNFVEKYEPAIPSRPVRAPKRAPAPEPSEDAPEPSHPQPAVVQHQPTEQLEEEQAESPKDIAEPAKPEPVVSPPVSAAPPPASAPTQLPTSVPKSPPVKAATSKPPPPVAEKPTSSSFRDRIAAFNKPAAAPVTPFKPGGGPGGAFIKKPFVAPPPSRNAYVPPPREPPPQKIYRREEDPSVQAPEQRDTSEEPTATPDVPAEDQPKPQSLKDRIALLQKQQLEQAARNAEKKDKPKRPSKKRVESAEEVDIIPGTDPNLSKVDTNETVGRTSGELAEEDPRRAVPVASVTPQPQPSRELVSDTNDADDSGAGDEEDAQETSTEEERPKSKGLDKPATDSAKQRSADAAEDGEDDEEDEEEEEEDPEVRRRRELRERMAKMSGGMGMMGMFGPPGGFGAPAPARKPKASTESSRHASEHHQQDESQERVAPVRVALPGMSNFAPKRQEEAHTHEESEEDETARPTPQEPVPHGEPDDYVSRPLQRRSTDRPTPPAPPTPSDRAAPPAPPRDTRAVPPPPAGPRAMPPTPQSPTARAIPPIPTSPTATGFGAKDEASDEEQDFPTEAAPKSAGAEAPTSPTYTAPPPPPPPPTRTEDPPKLDTSESAISPTGDKRASRVPPPIPMSPTSPLTRAPPPPPPGQPPVRRSTSDSRGFAVTKSPAAGDSDEDEVTEYDGDYDTDIASSAKHKDALKAHNRDSSLDDGMLTDDAIKSPKSPPGRTAPPLPPPVPIMGAPREVPPPPPPQAAPKSRKSLDAPRAAPPPVPPPKIANDDEEYDPYRYGSQQQSAPIHSGRPQYTQTLQSPREEIEEDDLYGGSSQPSFAPPPLPPPTDRSAPPPPPPQLDYHPPPPPSFAPPPPTTLPEQTLDIKRSGTVSRRSMEHSRASGEQGFIAHDIDLGRNSSWWTQERVPPPALQGRQDVLYEIESSSSTKRGGRTTISKDIYVLYIDYSSTTINASFDSADPSHVTLEQSHERPPPPPRHDQLESASTQYGAQIARAASSLAGSAIGDGSGQAFILELLKPHTTALQPIGNRAYGARVYANLGNASTQQFDEIRPGDIVTFRNAKFAGHKGGLHAKYTMDVGKPDHVAVVIDWDGTKKKIRAWEQGREEKGKRPKVREESFKVGDLKSGEVMVWRVMPRGWVGWDKSG